MKQIFIDFPIKQEIKDKSETCVMAMGFFDGVHLGHREIIKEARQIAARKKLKLAVMTFFPHPSSVIPKGTKVTHYLTTLETKARIFENLGVDLMYVVEFNKQVAAIPHDQFVNDYLCGLGVKHAIAGFDYKYGHRGKGDMEQLKIDSKGRFEVTTVSKLSKNEQKIGSTLLRGLLTEGKVEQMSEYLGRNYQIYGCMDGQGKSVHIKYNDECFLPCSGTYEVTVYFQGIKAKGMCEVHSANPPGELHVQLFREFLIGYGEAVVLEWNNFIADFTAKEFHAQTNIMEAGL
ncbi:FAD synthetase family protein [Halobacillus massiliensis]|uniref:FAD synthetase family protein n=1 Tax=Halobacillus massiliensis TaxID=1926286 RepID=UPI0009E453C0|nr:FAD synthetase family protein [Halobacillus massiliensis]